MRRPGPSAVRRALATRESFDIKLLATDTGGLTAAETFHFTVGAGATQNHLPVIFSNSGGNTASVIITDHSKYVATVHAVDQDAGSSLTYSIVGGKNEKQFSIDPSRDRKRLRCERLTPRCH
jgi:hypothetical protein